jgi:hypothetical protein
MLDGQLLVLHCIASATELQLNKMRPLATAGLFALLLAVHAHAQEKPYFVTYDHQMEEPGNLEVAPTLTIGPPRKGQRVFFGHLLELEYGVTGWWTTELYLEGQSTRGDSTIFTGWRMEHRFRPLAREHRVNPVFYFEYEDINEASRIFKEVVGHADGIQESNSDLRAGRARELEFKLIFSSTVRDWNISENVIFEKNLSQDEGTEFGYAFGFYRPLGRLASAKQCRLCRENFTLGAEFFGGLGSSQAFGLQDTAHYAAPALAWRVGNGSSLHFSPAIGLTRVSSPVLFRIGYSYEVMGFSRSVSRMFKRSKNAD